MIEGKDEMQKGKAYLDPNAPIEQRVEDLLSKMTLEEKIRQLKARIAVSREHVESSCSAI